VHDQASFAHLLKVTVDEFTAVLLPKCGLVSTIGYACHDWILCFIISLLELGHFAGLDVRLSDGVQGPSASTSVRANGLASLLLWLGEGI
tara:strand:- start:62 stop:331 length:270 start_codon:yes stop_codon:yes gene_type:complete